MIINNRFNVSAGLLPVCKVDDNIKGVIKSTIVKISARVGGDDFKKVLFEALPDRIEDTDDIANSAITNKMIVTGGPKREMGI